MITGDRQRRTAIGVKERSIDWFCLPDFDSPSIFAKLWTRKKEGASISRCRTTIPLPKTTTEYKYPTYTVRIAGTWLYRVDYMPRYHTVEKRHYMPPEIHRYVRVIKGQPKVRVIYDPQINYAREE